MPPMNLAFRTMLILSLFGCGFNGSPDEQNPAGLDTFTQIYGEERSRSRSISGQNWITITPDGSQSEIFVNGTLVGRVEPPASYQWSSSELHLVVNNGVGSGMTSRVLLFSNYDDGPKRIYLEPVVKGIVSDYSRCSHATVSPDSWGLGFEGDSLVIMVQPAVHAECSIDELIVFRFGLYSGAITEVAVDALAVEKYSKFLPEDYKNFLSTSHRTIQPR